jgi:hypothetical protein
MRVWGLVPLHRLYSMNISRYTANINVHTSFTDSRPHFLVYAPKPKAQRQNTTPSEDLPRPWLGIHDWCCPKWHVPRWQWRYPGLESPRCGGEDQGSDHIFNFSPRVFFAKSVALSVKPLFYMGLVVVMCPPLNQMKLPGFSSPYPYKKKTKLHNRHIWPSLLTAQILGFCYYWCIIALICCWMVFFICSVNNYISICMDMCTYFDHICK